MAQKKTVERGYGQEHREERARWQPLVDAGQAWCCAVTCLMPSRWIRPGTDWHLGHTPDRSSYLGPCHTTCNLSEAGRRGNPRKNPPSQPKEPRWRPTTQW